jgi:integrase
MPRPWWWKARRGWYATLGNKQILLAQAPSKKNLAGRQAAERKLAELVTVQAAAADPTTLIAVCERFLLWSQANQAPKTHRWYQDFLVDFLREAPIAYVADLKPIHVTEWVDSRQNTWGDAARRGAITAVKRALNWAVEQGILEANPVASLSRPPIPKRETLVSPEDHQRMLGATDEPFARVLTALWELGARPIEVRTVTAAEVAQAGDAWVFGPDHPANKTGKKTRRPRVIYLTPVMIELTHRLLAERPEGHLFRDRRGKPWTSNAIRCRMTRLRKKLGLPEGTVAYSYRHTAATEALEAGTDVATVAELLGHRDIKMVAEHYGHLNQRHQHLRDEVKRVAESRNRDT